MKAEKGIKDIRTEKFFDIMKHTIPDSKYPMSFGNKLLISREKDSKLFTMESLILAQDER